MNPPGTDAGGASTPRPNIVVVMADDHAAHAIGAYGSRINETPGIDRLAREGMRFDAFFCTNSICSPSRATILTGTYNHVNGVTTLSTPFDARQPSFPGMLRDAGYHGWLSIEFEGKAHPDEGIPAGVAELREAMTGAGRA